MVDFCMRHGNPSTKSKVSEMVAAGCDRILFFPLYPQYAGATMGTANDQFFRALMEETWQPASRTIEPYFDDPAYIDALAQSVEKGYAAMGKRPDLLVVSYHGMPKRYLMQGAPYHCQCQKGTRLLKERLGWDESDITTTFQSVFGPEEWLKPYTVEEVARLAESGKKNIAVIAPAFSADCIETLEEIQEEIQEAFVEAGGESFTYIPCLNDEDAHIDALIGVAQRNLGGWLE
jgi:ferrochelatase